MMNSSRLMQVFRRPAASILVAVSFICLMVYLNRFDEPVYPSKRVIRYGFTIQNPTSSMLKDTGFWVYAPYKQTSSQKRLELKTSSPYEIRHDIYGNDKLNFTFDLPPHGSKEIWVESTLAVSEEPNRFPSDADVMTAGLITFRESGVSEIAEQAKKLISGGQKNSIVAIYDWVKEHISFSGYISDDRGALYALKTGEGDCTEYAYLTAALAQAQNIPVRVVAGFVMPQNGILSPAEYHNWAEFILDHAWHLADPQKEAIFAKSSSYIVMRIVGDVALSNADNSQRFFGTLNGVQVEMKTPSTPMT